MNLPQMHEYFDVLIDKYGGIYFTSEEKDTFFTDAINEYILDSIEQRSNVKLTRTKTPEVLTSLESTIRSLESIQPYIYNVVVTADATTGNVNISDLNEAIRFSEEGVESLGIDYSSKYIMSVAKRNTPYTSKLDAKKVKFVRHNDIYEFLENDFKKPSSTNPAFLLNKQELEILPPDTTGIYNISGIRSVEPIRYDEANYGEENDNSVEPAIDNMYKQRIVRLAVSLAVASVGDLQKAQLIKNEEDF